MIPQTSFVFRIRGGARRRRSTGRRSSVPHRARPALDARNPVHVTLRVRRQVGFLRQQAPFAVLRDSFAAAKDRLGMRIVHFSVQSDHIHLLVEADDEKALSRGARGLTIRIARRLNQAIGRAGPVFAERYHARALASPTEVRSAIVYVLNNFRKHGERLEPGDLCDPCSSARWFTGWRGGALPRAQATGPPAVVPPSTWLLARGWMRAGSVGVGDAPGPRRRRRSGPPCYRQSK